MEVGDVLLEVLLCLLVDPLLEVVEIKGMRVLDLPWGQPLAVSLEVIWYFLAVEDAVDHVAAEEAEFDLVAGVGMDLLVLVDRLEDVGSGWTVCKLQLVEGLLRHLGPVTFFEVFYVDLAQHVAGLVVAILKEKMCFHVLLL